MEVILFMSLSANSWLLEKSRDSHGKKRCIKRINVHSAWVVPIHRP